MKLAIDIHHFVELQKKSYSLDHVFLLKLLHQDIDISEMCKDSMKINALHQGLVRKGLITEDGKLTINGTELLVFLDTKEKSKFVKTKPKNTDFNEWWKTYPGTDTFTYKGKTFTGSRSLRPAKEDCKIKFDKILLEGEYTAQDLIDALKFDVLQKKEASLKENTNKLKYMQNSLTYLNQRSFEPYIELIKEGVKIKESQEIQNGTDI